MLTDKVTVKAATITLKLRADSGYMSDEQHRISAEQWGRIVAICNEKEGRAADAAETRDAKGGE